jgi:hypothetical protein
MLECSLRILQYLEYFIALLLILEGRLAVPYRILVEYVHLAFGLA